MATKQKTEYDIHKLSMIFIHNVPDIFYHGLLQSKQRRRIGHTTSWELSVLAQ